MTFGTTENNKRGEYKTDILRQVCAMESFYVELNKKKYETIHIKIRFSSGDRKPQR